MDVVCQEEATEMRS